MVERLTMAMYNKNDKNNFTWIPRQKFSLCLSDLSIKGTSQNLEKSRIYKDRQTE